MRETFTAQPTLIEPWLDVPYAKELKVVSDLLDQDPMLCCRVTQDLCRGSSSAGRSGMSGEQVLRALILKQMNGFSYRELAFHLEDSRTFRTFCRIGFTDSVPKRGTLAQNIKRISAETLEAINRELIGLAVQHGIEKGRKVRIDSTVVEANIHSPSDSSLLWDCVRVLTRLMDQIKAEGVEQLVFANRTRRAKRRALEIQRAKTKRGRRKLYRDLLLVVDEVTAAAGAVAARAREHKAASVTSGILLDHMAQEIDRYLELTSRVVEQTRRRVFLDEKVPASEKIVSIFEEHTDIIVKAPRETQFGHHVTLTGGGSSLILDCVISDGNPGDSTMATTMVERQIDLYGRAPRQAAFDGGYASRENLESLKDLGVKDVVFHKRRGLQVEEMAKSRWVYKKLRDFRAGIEGCISFLKRAFGLRRCTWRSLRSFKSYVWASIVSANLLTMARHLLA
jgi:IS5 family transposase